VVVVPAAGFAVPAVVAGLPTVGTGSVGVRGVVGAGVSSGVADGQITGVAGGAAVVDGVAVAGGLVAVVGGPVVTPVVAVGSVVAG
jgi:hypothetical protein